MKQTTTTSNPSGAAYRSAADMMGEHRGAAVYRSLAMVESSSETLPFEVRRVTDKAHAHLNDPVASKRGEVFWDASGAKMAAMKANMSKEESSKPMPIPLIVVNAPHKTLYLQSDPVGLVIDQVHDLLERHAVDCQYHSDLFKWKCFAYGKGGAETSFVCRLFTVPDKVNYFILDFQRRSGDAYHFTSLYKGMHNELLKSGFVVNCGSRVPVDPPAPVRTFNAPQLPAEFKDVMEEKAEDFTPLCNMCTSQYVEVSRQGLTALSGQLLTNPNAKTMLAPFAEKLVSLAGMSRDPQIKRLACTSLCELSSVPMAQRVIVDRSGTTVLTQLLFNEDELVETRRKAAQTLLNLCHVLPKEVALVLKKSNLRSKDKRFEQIVSQLQLSC